MRGRVRRLPAAVCCALALGVPPVLCTAAQRPALPEIGGEDVPRQTPLPPPAAQDAPGDGEEPRATFGETIDVVVSTHVVRVLRDDGTPILGLSAPDFRAVGHRGEALPVLDVDWIDSGAAVAGWKTPRRDADLPAESGGGAVTPTAVRLAELPGKLVVVFVQADFNGQRIYGHLKQLPNVRQLLDTLAPRDRVAVVSFDTHMELWQDFTRDRDTAQRAVWRAIHFGADPPAGEGAAERPGPSLAALLDERAMADAAYAENALELLGDALAELPDDEKVILLLGWGLGRYGFGGFRMRPNDYPQALAALRRSNASVFVLDVMDAASHTLEIGLKQVAAQTGGVYIRTAVNPMQAFRRMAQALSGYYLVSVDAAGADVETVTFAVVGQERWTRVMAHPVRVE